MHKKIWRLAAPIMLANITIPLLGAVDLAVVGRMPGPEFMAAVGVGATVFSVLYFGFVFLRMGTTGLVAISKGALQHSEGVAWLLRAVLLGLALGLVLIVLSKPIASLSQWLIEPPALSAPLFDDYFFARIFSAPASLANFAFLGWMIGMQRAKTALAMQLVINLTNIVLDLVFVLWLGLGVKGVAWATVIAEYVGLGFALMMVLPYVAQYFKSHCINALFVPEKIMELAHINVHIFVRSMCLQMAFFYFTARGADFGDAILAVNAILMNFLLFTSYALDGFANASEALVGESIGRKDRTTFKRVVKAMTLWALFFAILFTIAYGLSWEFIVNLMTNVESVKQLVPTYLIWGLLLPLTCVWSFLLDGIFIGATVTKPMRNSMALSLGLFIGLTTILIPAYQNHGLWISFLCFMLARAVFLSAYWSMLNQKFKR